ncbi:MAG: peptidylprolyl isomerase [Planctomycetota bacterium]
MEFRTRIGLGLLLSFIALTVQPGIAQEATDSDPEAPNVVNRQDGVPTETEDKTDGESAGDGEKGIDTDKPSELPPEYFEELERRMKVFKTSRLKLEKAVGDQRIIQIRYLNREQRTPKDREAFYEKRLEVRKLLDEVYLTALEVLRLGAEKDSATYVVTLLQNRIKHSYYDAPTLEGAARLLDRGLSPLLYVYQVAARSAICVGDFEVAGRLLEAIPEEKRDQLDKTLMFHLPGYKDAFEKEIVIREKEEAEDRLPRVKLETTQGDVIVELFIDQAPSAVSHFISLVEKGYYDGNDFSQVIADLFALTGDPTGTGGGNSGKFLMDEHDRPDARKGLRGSLVMAKLPIGETGKFVPHSASSQFAILYLPIMSVSEEQTIFGRVIEGMENISYLRKVDPHKEKEKGEVILPPDRITKATVIRRPEVLPEPKFMDPMQQLSR